jgi:dipeptidyl-peptidase-3
MAKPYIPLSTTLTELDCEVAFNALAEKQVHYAYNFLRSSWHGSKICYFERSYESPALLYIFLKAFEKGARQTVDSIRAQFEEVAINQILIYVAAFIDNNGNYKSFGDSKFIPECSEEVFRNFFLATPYWSNHV